MDRGGRSNPFENIEVFCMDDFNISSLHESRNEWTSRLLTIMTPLVIEGLKSIFDESLKLCENNNENDKYLLTFQNLISRIPHWNPAIIEQEKKRIVERSGCSYLHDLITCTHIIQLKLMTAIRAGNKQKKIDIQIPKLDDFIHKTYIHVARKIYKNVYLFELKIPPLQIQKNHRELEIIIQECILTAIRESIPVESILRAYMDETMEEEIIEEIKEQVIEDPKAKVEKEIADEIKREISQSTDTKEGGNKKGEEETFLSAIESPRISFNDIDHVQQFDGSVEDRVSPKDDATLAAKSAASNTYGGGGNEEEDENEGKLTIYDDPISLDSLDIHRIDDPEIKLSLPDLLIDAEVLG